MKVVYFPALTLKAKHSKPILLVRVWVGVGRADAKRGGGVAWAFLLGKGWPYLNMSMNK